jgi:hypothetical protein
MKQMWFPPALGLTEYVIQNQQQKPINTDKISNNFMEDSCSKIISLWIKSKGMD